MATCTKCGREVCKDELIDIEDELVCKDCAEEMGYVQCQDCGEWFKAEYGYEYEDEPLCESCYENNYCTCEDCGEIIPYCDAVAIHDSRRIIVCYVCEDCADNNYYQCEDCGRWFTENAVYTDDYDNVVCTRCFDYNGWNTCEDCGLLTHDLYEGDDGEYYCESCFGDHQSEFSTRIADCNDADNGAAIHNYGYKPRADIRKRANERDTELTFGIEDEVDSPDYRMSEKAIPTAEAIKALTDRVYMKRDGSLSTGFEIVSHPGTLAHHMYEMPWRGICSKALKAGFRSHDAGTCGLHIHVGRAGLGDDEGEINRTIRKVIVLVNRYWTELARFTRRSVDRLNQWGPRNRIDGYTPDMVITDRWASRIPVANSHSNRYQAINCENEATIEFRIFRGTLKRDTIIASLQLCWNICNYAKAHDWADIQTGTWLDVARYRRWNELDAYLTVRGLAPAVQPAQNSNHTPNFGGVDGIRGDE